MSSGEITFHGESYEEGASRFDGAHEDLSDAEAAHEGLQGKTADQLDGWIPGLGSGLREIEGTLGKGLSAAKGNARDIAAKLRDSRTAMNRAEADSTRPSENLLRKLGSDRADSGTAGGLGTQPGTESERSPLARLLNGENPGAADGENLSLEPGASNTPEGKRFKTNSAIDRTLERVNPKYKRGESAYSENCTGVVQANELTRRGVPSEAGPLEKPLRTDEGGPGGRKIDVIEKPWGVKFKPGSKAEIEEAFKEPGSRGIVYIKWNRRGAHVFNVENVDGKVRFVDGQPNPPLTDASSHFERGHSTMYVRLDDRPTPPGDATKPYLEPGKGS